jgi:hypothetical protein
MGSVRVAEFLGWQGYHPNSDKPSDIAVFDLKEGGNLMIKKVYKNGQLVYRN